MASKKDSRPLGGSCVAPEVVIVGSANMDLVTYTHHMPKPGETLVGKEFKTAFGGKGANQAIAASNLFPASERCRVACVCKLGNDEFGKQYYKYFTDLGLCNAGVMWSTGSNTGVAQITVTQEGENCIIIIPGANNTLMPEDLRQPQIANMLQNARVILCQNEVPPETTTAAFQIAKESGLANKPLTLFSPAPATLSLPVSIFQNSNFVVLNELEVQQIASMLVGDTFDERYEECARHILKKLGTKLDMLVTLGERGSYLVGHSCPLGKHIAAEKLPKELVVDTVGAGDCFVASFAYFLTLGVLAEEAAGRASVVAAKAVQKRGASESYPKREELPSSLFVSTYFFSSEE